jgi:5-hydroxyisourate hydrolase
MSQITTHVLDISVGRPAAGVQVTLEIQKAGGWKEISRGATDADGRLRHLLEPGTLA